jgi:hypothetical protein
MSERYSQNDKFGKKWTEGSQGAKQLEKEAKIEKELAKQKEKGQQKAEEEVCSANTNTTR